MTCTLSSLQETKPCFITVYLKVQGPYIFVRYIGKLQVTAVIAALDGGGTMWVVSAANLLPMWPSKPLPYGPHVWEEDDDSSNSTEASGD